MIRSEQVWLVITEALGTRKTVSSLVSWVEASFGVEIAIVDLAREIDAKGVTRCSVCEVWFYPTEVTEGQPVCPECAGSI